MIREYQAEFIERRNRTPTAVSYRFQKPSNLDFMAGQYMLVDLGDGLIHPLSLSNCPEDSKYIEFTKRMTGSPFCHRLKSMQKGETISVKGPSGTFCLPDETQNVVMIAGGIGITPFMSILSSLERKEEKKVETIVLIYGNTNKADIAFKNELENLQLPNYRLVHVLSDPTGMEGTYQGFINEDIIAKEVPNNKKTLFMVSGPPVMVEAITKSLAGINVDKDNIRTDKFLGY